MAIFGNPFVPYTITVHLGLPDEWAENLVVSFPEYIKNVASSEIYPTWDEAALRANIIAQISFALNRIYTEYYRSRGYDFSITSSTSIDQMFIKDRNIFQNISDLVDQIFNQYIRRQGFVEPLLAQFCNGTTSTCDGLSQWGSQSLATVGYDYFSILENYYGTNIELVTDAPIQTIEESYPQRPIRKGDIGESVYYLQVMLNRVARTYPAIPSVWPETGVFDDLTDQAVRTFQSVFNLQVDGIVGPASWYKLVYFYTGLKQLGELVSEGSTYLDTPFSRTDHFTIGDTGEHVQALQYLINVLAAFDTNIPPIPITGLYDEATRQAILVIQSQYGLTQNGIVDPVLLTMMLDQYGGIQEGIFGNTALFPPGVLAQNTLSPEEVQRLYDTIQVQAPGRSLFPGASPQSEIPIG